MERIEAQFQPWREGTVDTVPETEKGDRKGRQKRGQAKETEKDRKGVRQKYLTFELSLIDWDRKGVRQKYLTFELSLID